MAEAGARMAHANVAGIYLIHGTFCGNDWLGLLTELARVAPALSRRLQRVSKASFDLALRETGNYTRGFAARLQRALSAGAGRAIPVRRFNWSSQNTHVARADGAVRLLDELQRSFPGDAQPQPGAPPQRVQVWAHSHGGNVAAILTNLLGGDREARRAFFAAAAPYYRNRRGGVDFLPWQRAEQLLAGDQNPLAHLRLDVVTFGTPVRYGWDSAGYARLLHVANHRPNFPGHDWRVRFPHLHRALTARDGDVVQQIGIAGSGFPVLPIAWRTHAANRQLRELLAAGVPRWLFTNLAAGVRVPDEGATLLVDYDDPAWFPLCHLFGHAAFTRSRWLPLHCELIVQEFYGAVEPAGGGKSPNAPST